MEATEEAAVLAAIHAGDQGAFAALSDRYRRQLHVHCYRMLGSFDDAEDLVQETLLRAWRSRDGFEGRSLFRTWLYRIATNACLNFLERGPRRVLPQDVAPPVTADTNASEARDTPAWAPEIPWLQPYPDDLLEPAAPTEDEPDRLAVSRENIQIAFLAALQHLPPRQRSILILCDVLGWSAKEVAAQLEMTVAAVNSALQRANATMRTRLPAGRQDRARITPQTDAERTLLEAFMHAWTQSDVAALTDLLCEDARWAMPPAPLWFDGRAAIERLFQLFPPSAAGTFTMVPTAANRQPAAGAYLRKAGESVSRLVAIHVLRVEERWIAEITTFSGPLCARFRLPTTL